MWYVVSKCLVRAGRITDETGVCLLSQMFVGSFEPDDFFQFQTDVQDTFNEFQSAGLSQLIIDLSNNGGGSFESHFTCHLRCSVRL